MACTVGLFMGTSANGCPCRGMTNGLARPIEAEFDQRGWDLWEPGPTFCWTGVQQRGSVQTVSRRCFQFPERCLKPFWPWTITTIG